jgi:hypothetical protein
MESELKKYMSNVDELITLYKQKVERIERERNELHDKCVRYEAALKDIVDPIAYLRKQAEKEGAILDGYYAVILSKDESFLKGIAVKALSAGEGGKEPLFTSEQVQAMLIEFALAYQKSLNKDIANDAAEYLYDKLGEVEQEGDKNGSKRYTDWQMERFAAWCLRERVTEGGISHYEVTIEDIKQWEKEDKQ